MKRILSLFLIVSVLFALAACNYDFPGISEANETETTEKGTVQQKELDEHGAYYTLGEVALFIHTYNRLPDNYITKKEAQKLGWGGGSLEKYAPGKCIGGERFGNYEGKLPKAKGRVYKECDIVARGARSRGGKRIVYSNDGLIYYTDDHYKSFKLLYGEDDS